MIGRFLGEAKDIRAKADYRLDSDFKRGEMQQTLDLYRRINQWTQSAFNKGR